MGPKAFLEKIKDKPYLVTLGLLGMFLVVVGVFSVMVVGGKSQDEGVVIKKTEIEEAEVLVDVGGAVIKPGVYQLMVDSRINDALAAAGGLNAEADRGWVSQNLNLAQKLTDGVKIYIPSIKDSPSQSKGESLSEKININTASSAELDTLYGVGPATAEKIIQNRPYGAVEELLSKKVVNNNVYESIKDQITVY